MTKKSDSCLFRPWLTHVLRWLSSYRDPTVETNLKHGRGLAVSHGGLRSAFPPSAQHLKGPSSSQLPGSERNYLQHSHPKQSLSIVSTACAGTTACNQVQHMSGFWQSCGEKRTGNQNQKMQKCCSSETRWNMSRCFTLTERSEDFCYSFQEHDPDRDSPPEPAVILGRPWGSVSQQLQRFIRHTISGSSFLSQLMWIQTVGWHTLISVLFKTWQGWETL